jgi:hypothetical protein
VRLSLTRSSSPRRVETCSARHAGRAGGKTQEASMFKPNYNQQRAERRRAQQAKQEEKLKEQREATARRRAARAEAEAAKGGADDENTQESKQ